MVIKIHRNNSGAVKLTILNAEGQAWNIPDTHTLKWTVKKSTAYPDEDIIIQKELTGDGGNVYFVNLKGKDTNISVGLYKWDLKDTTQNLTLLEGNFVIEEVAFVGATIDGIIEELQEITGNVEVGVFEGGSGTEDYNELYNKPKINNVTLIGNKTGENLGLADSDTVSLIQQEVELKADKSELPTKTSDLTNDSGFIAETVIDNKDTAILTSATAYADTIASTKQNTLTAGQNITINNNIISATDTTYTAGSGIDITDNVITATGGSGGTSDYTQLSNKPSINSVTLSGNKTTADLNISYNDLTNKPTIPTVPTKTSDLTNDSGFITSSSLPTKTSDLTNDSGYITSEDIPAIPTKTSDLTNDSGFITSSSLPTKTSDLTNDSGFIDSTYHDSTKQNTLTAGTGINITGDVISATGSGGTSDYTQLSNKPSINSITLTGNKSLSDLGIQHQLTAGTNITISNNVISASGGGGGGSDIATDTLNNKLESYILRGEVVDINALNTLLENKINGVT